MDAVDNGIIEVNLTPEGTKKMTKSSEENLNNSLVALADGKIISAMGGKSKLSDFVPITQGYQARVSLVMIGKPSQNRQPRPALEKNRAA